MTSEEYKQSLERISVLMDLDPDPESYQGRELIALVEAVCVYESKIYPLARVVSGVS